MNKKIIVNMILSIFLYWSAAILLYRDSVFLSSLKNPEEGSLFSGWSLYLLAFSLFLLGTLSLLVARGWTRGDVPESGWKRPLVKGSILRRYWYLMLLFAVSMSAAFYLAETAPSHRTVSETASAENHASGP